MAPHSSTLAWKIPWTGEPGGLLSMGSHRVGHDWSDLAAATAVISDWRRQWHPTPVLLPGKSHGRRNPVGCSPWGREESDTTEATQQQQQQQQQQGVKNQQNLENNYWVGQKVHSDFSITSYRKTQMSFLANPAYPLGAVKRKSRVTPRFLLYHHYSIIVAHVNRVLRLCWSVDQTFVICYFSAQVITVDTALLSL